MFDQNKIMMRLRLKTKKKINKMKYNKAKIRKLEHHYLDIQIMQIYVFLVDSYTHLDVNNTI